MCFFQCCPFTCLLTMYPVHFHQFKGLRVKPLVLVVCFFFSVSVEAFRQILLEFISPIYCARPCCRYNNTTTTTTQFVLTFVLTGGIGNVTRKHTKRPLPEEHTGCGALKHQQRDGTTWSAQPVRDGHRDIGRCTMSNEVRAM